MTRALVGIAMLFAAASAASADDRRVKSCMEQNTVSDQRECAHQLYLAVSAELDQVYRHTIKQAEATARQTPAKETPPNLPSWPDAIASSQKAWEAYREAEC